MIIYTFWPRINKEQAYILNFLLKCNVTASVVKWSEFLATYPGRGHCKKKKISGSGTGSTQPREYNWAVNGVTCVAEK
jgi:hypothetical protein